MNKFALLLVALFGIVSIGVSLDAKAVSVAVVDSGTDLKHKDLKDQAWVNPNEIEDNKDNDKNGKADDINGWNFAEKNNQIIDYKYLGTFSPDPYKFFEIQLKIFNGTATADEIAWVKAKREDQAFLEEMQKFGNFVHGTHVAGIAATAFPATKIMGVKLIPTEPPKAPGKGDGKIAHLNSLLQNEITKVSVLDDGSGIDKDKLLDLAIKKALESLAAGQGKQLEPIGLYLWFHKVKVANCSFGTSTKAFAGILKQLLAKVYKREPTEEEVMKYSKYFVGKVVELGRQWMVDAKDTLFVIAAGNDGMNNDEYPTYPANVKRDNAISVAATFGYDKIASFSNFGSEMVEVAAPGVGILSAIPGDQYLTVSGTSQAAPFVTNVAAKVLETNPQLTFPQAKKILMETSDQKDFLKGKVKSGGIVNSDRAVKAAHLAKSMPIDDAIRDSKWMVVDFAPSSSEFMLTSNADDSATLLEMPNLLK